MSKIIDYFKQFSPKDLRTKQIPELLFVCGGNGEFPHQIRNQLIERLKSENHKIVKPEDFLQFNNGQLFKKDLLELERYYAALVSLIPLSCESFGSAAELGAFVNDAYIKSKLFVIMQQVHYDDPNSFIANGIVKNFEYSVSLYKRGNRVYTTTNNPHDDIEEICNEISKSTFISTKCDFNNSYFQIQLLMTIINAKMISEKKELESEFREILEHLGGEFQAESFIEMISVGRHLGKITEVSSGMSRFYLSKDGFTYFERQTRTSEKATSLELDFTSVRKSYIQEIYESKDPITLKKKKVIESHKVPLQQASPAKIQITNANTNSAVFKAPLMYKTYYIPKRSGGKREISQPTALIKKLQRAAIEQLSEIVTVHESSVAYKKGLNGILANAKIHKDSKFFCKLDFSNFFPSIKAIDLLNWLEVFDLPKEKICEYVLLFAKFNKGSPAEIVKTVRRTLISYYVNPNRDSNEIYGFLKSHSEYFELSIGAPSSPFVSNAIMFEFDQMMTKCCDVNGLKYSRFADDITISGQKKLDIKVLESDVKVALIASNLEGLKINDKKSKIISFSSRVTITGLNLTPLGKVSLGRSRKKLISAMVHRFTLNKLEISKINELRGWISFAMSVEPTYFDSLEARYGESIEKILRFSL